MPVNPKPAPGRAKPRLRGVVHEHAFFCSLPIGVALVLSAPSLGAAGAAAIYAAAVSTLLGVSALYHRVTWQPTARRRMRALDHSMILVLIAATYTAVALGVGFNLLWVDAPKPLTASAYAAVALLSVPVLPQLVSGLGPLGVSLTLARRRPLRRRRCHLCAAAPQPPARGVRLPRGLSRPGGRRAGGAVSGDRLFRPAGGGLIKAPSSTAYGSSRN